MHCWRCGCNPAALRDATGSMAAMYYFANSGYTTMAVRAASMRIRWPGSRQTVKVSSIPGRITLGAANWLSGGNCRQATLLTRSYFVPGSLLLANVDIGG